jgi:hypothetical protein
MPTDGTPKPDDALAQAITELRAEYPEASGEPSDRYWLRLGITLGLRQPGRASLVLGVLEAGAAAHDPAPSLGVTAGAAAGAKPATVDRRAAADAVTAIELEGSSTDGDGPADPNEVPVRSLLLSRSASLPASTDPVTVFGWVGQLSALEIRRLGNVVTELLAGGAFRDLERGFGLAWSAGARLPREDLRGLFGRFGELELAICGVLGGRDLLSIARPPENSVGVVLSVFVRRSNPAVTEASAILEREGEPARRGLVAIWNAWVALRYRDLIAPPLFEQLVGAWVAVVGPVPGA